MPQVAPSVVFVTLMPPPEAVFTYSMRVKNTRSFAVTVSHGSDWYVSCAIGIRMFGENVEPPSVEYANPTRCPPPLWVGASFQPTKILPWESTTIVGSTW